MDVGNSQIDAAGALSVLAWWQEAGVDVAVEEAPTNWLARARPAPAPAAPVEAKAPAAPLLPDTLDAFHRWLAEGDDVPEANWGRPRILPTGDPASGLMILGDLPEREDARAGRLWSGEVGALFDKMMTAIKRSRDSLYLAPIASVRPPGGRVDEASAARLKAIALHHIALIAPKRLLLMGEAPTRLLLGTDLRDARGSLQMLNHDGGSTQVVATFKPRFLLDRPAAKAEAWKDLQLLVQGLDA